MDLLWKRRGEDEEVDCILLHMRDVIGLLL